MLSMAAVIWTGFGETTTDEEGRKIWYCGKDSWYCGKDSWYCGEDSKHQYGVTFLVRKEVEGSIHQLYFHRRM